jgi:hypothetical protein
VYASARRRRGWKQWCLGPGPFRYAALSCDGVARGLGLLSRCFGVMSAVYRPRATRFAQRRPNDPASKRADNETRANETRRIRSLGG